MLTTFEKYVFILVRVLYPHLPRFPYDWDPNFVELHQSSSRRCWSALLAGWIVADLVSFGNIYVLMTNHFNQQSFPLDVIQVFGLSTGVILCFVVEAIGLMLLANVKEFLAGYNRVQKLDTVLIKGMLQKLVYNDI